MTKVDLTKPIYHDNDAAREHLETLLWPEGPVCPRCGVMGDRITKLKGKSTRPGVYKCKDCRKPFSVTVGTVMERSKVPLCKWVLAAQLMASSKKGMSALQLQRMIGTNYETAWFLFHRLRECAIDPKRGPIGGENKVVEADETYVGGKAKNARKGKPVPKKVAVFALVERDGEVRSFHVTNVNAKTLRPILVKNASRKSYLMTDETWSIPRSATSSPGTAPSTTAPRIRSGHVLVHQHGRKLLRAAQARDDGLFPQLSAKPTCTAISRSLISGTTTAHNRRGRADALLKGAKGKRLMYHQPSEAANA